LSWQSTQFKNRTFFSEKLIANTGINPTVLNSEKNRVILFYKIIMCKTQLLAGNHQRCKFCALDCKYIDDHMRLFTFSFSYFQSMVILITSWLAQMTTASRIQRAQVHSICSADSHCERLTVLPRKSTCWQMLSENKNFSIAVI